MKTKKALFYKIGALLLLVAIAVTMFIIGRGHTIYFDNKTMEYEGKTYDAPYKVVVYVKGEQIAKLYAKERGMTTWIGQNFEVYFEVTEQKGGEETTATYFINLPYNMDGIIINIPAYLAGLPEEAYISQFIPVVPDEPTEEVPVTDEFGGLITDESSAEGEVPAA